MSAVVKTDRSSAESCLAHFADFCKAMAIYPEANSRVRMALDAFLELARTAGPVRIAIPILGAEDPPHLPNIEWLQERFLRSGLAAIDVPADIPEESVRALGRRLLRNYVYNETASRFEELWPEPIEAVTLRARIFDGRFDGGNSPGGAGEGNGAAPGAASGDTGGTGSASLSDGTRTGVGEGGTGEHGGGGEGTGGGIGDGEGAGAETKDKGPLGSVLWNKARDKISDTYDDIAHDAGDEMCRQFLERVSNALPKELTGQKELGDQACHRILDEITLDPIPTEAALGAMLVNVHRDLSGGGRGNHRDGWKNGEPEEKEEEDGDKAKARKQGHKGDAGIVEDRAAFLEELKKLPTARSRPLTPAEAQIKAEQLDVMLHYALEAKEPVVRARLADMAKSLLGDLGPDELNLLGNVLKQHWNRADNSGKRSRARLLELLGSAGHIRLLRTVGVLTPEYIVEAFPVDFVLYVDCIDTRLQDDRRELVRVCQQISPEAVVAATSTLIGQDGLLVGAARRDTLLSVHDLAVKPFAKLLMHADGEGSRGVVLTYLAALHGGHSIAGALNTLEAGTWLPKSLLVRLLELNPGDDAKSFSLRDEATRVTAAMFETFEQGPRESEDRLRCIRALGLLSSEGAIRMLKRIRGARRWLFIPIEPKSVRDAASRAIAVAQAGGLSHV